MSSDQLNVEYFFRLIYELVYGSHSSLEYTAFQELLSHIWLWIIVIGYTISLAAFILIVYATKNLFDLRKREKEFYSTLLVTPEQDSGSSPRWTHIQSLMEATSPSAWREAIVEADIMLDDLLTQQEYTGDSIGEKLKSLEASGLSTLNEAWEAHKVRNQIAHQGSTFDLSENLARRTIAQYEAVFREFQAI